MNLKLLSIISLFVFTSVSLFSQVYKNPESVVYDESGDRYFVSNKGGNTIVILKNDQLTSFVDGLEMPKGLLIKDTILISVNSTYICGFDIEDGEQVFKYSVAGASFMNDAVIGKDGYLFITDSNQDKIFKMDLSDGSVDVFVDSGIDPNGIVYDKANDRLMFCENGGNAKIRAVNFETAEVTDLVSTGVSDLDGLGFDKDGNIYVSSWGAKSVYRYKSDFSEDKVLFGSGFSGPADFCIDTVNNIIAVPNFNLNNVVLLDLNKTTNIEFSEPDRKNVIIENPVISVVRLNVSADYFWIYSTSGSVIKSDIVWDDSIDVSDVSNGLYQLVLKVNGKIISEQLIIQ